MSIGFLLLNSLDILDYLETVTTEDDRQHWIDWIYLCQHPTGGFRGSPATKTSGDSIYDAPHLPAAYFAIASLLILGDDLNRPFESFVVNMATIDRLNYLNLNLNFQNH